MCQMSQILRVEIQKLVNNSTRRCDIVITPISGWEWLGSNSPLSPKSLIKQEWPLILVKSPDIFCNFQRYPNCSGSRLLSTGRRNSRVSNCSIQNICTTRKQQQQQKIETTRG
mmetsp:Transcript_28894/g.67082  ORF Transcript_28894/g.67082 Transcript_28894/m.67082 type:complete len:113 (+) Transcript_28894:474-812(+)